MTAGRARVGTDSDRILVLNGGSSSIKFAVFAAGANPLRRSGGKIERIGLGGTTLTFADATAGRTLECKLPTGDHSTAADALVDRLEAEGVLASVAAIGHRVVHGLDDVRPQRVTPELLADLWRLAPIDPEHMPMALGLIDVIGRRLPQVPQVVCFDSAFHATLPRVAQQLAIPRRYQAQGIRRYGFHGLSYAYLLEELGRCAGESAARGRVVLAHLGSGASLAAVRDGCSIDTSMGFSPNSGLPMGTRSGDLDPGVAAYLERSQKLSAADFFSMATQESGLLGLSETSSDLRDLLHREGDDLRAAEAVALFCYQAKKWVGAYAAALGGIDTLVFSGGIGENSAVVRERICAGLEFLGIALDAAGNEQHAAVISSAASRATVRVIRTDEELMIAKSVSRLLR